MGYFKDLEIDIIDMYREDGMKETEIAKSLGISVTQVHQVLSKYDAGDFDYDIQDGDVVSYDDLTNEPDDSDYNAEHYA
jgi:predicted transcriptional regulator